MYLVVLYSVGGSGLGTDETIVNQSVGPLSATEGFARRETLQRLAISDGLSTLTIAVDPGGAHAFLAYRLC